MFKALQLPLILKHKRTGLTDQDLVQLCAREDAAAQRILFERYASTMLGVCFRYVKSKDEAQDVLQDGFIKVFNNLAKFRGESSLQTWITRIMINTALNYIKSNEKFRWDSDVDELEDNGHFTTEQFHLIDTNVLMECIQQLPAGYRVVLNMYAIEGYSHKEIATELDITESTSRSQFARAKALLEKRLTVLGFDTKKYGAGKF